MSRKVAQYQEEDYLIIRDIAEAKQYISTQDDIESGMILQVKHNFDCYLVCKPVDVAEVERAKGFPPSTADYTSHSSYGYGQKKCS